VESRGKRYGSPLRPKEPILPTTGGIDFVGHFWGTQPKHHTTIYNVRQHFFTGKITENQFWVVAVFRGFWLWIDC
jgi:hypothetical protein